MKIKFTKDFANNWKAGDIVEVKYISQDEVLVDDVAKVDLHLLLKHCVVLPESEEQPVNCKNCFDGYLTSECEECEFWKDGTTDEGIGCATPYPISHCKAFAKECEGRNNKNLLERR